MRQPRTRWLTHFMTPRRPRGVRAQRHPRARRSRGFKSAARPLAAGKRKRAAKARRKVRLFPSAPSRHGTVRSLPLRSPSQWGAPICGMAGPRACFFRSKACHYAPFHSGGAPKAVARAAPTACLRFSSVAPVSMGVTPDGAAVKASSASFTAAPGSGISPIGAAADILTTKMVWDSAWRRPRRVRRLGFWACSWRSRSCASVKGRRGKPGPQLRRVGNYPIPRPRYSRCPAPWETGAGESARAQLSRLPA